jgi:DNA (cytosine-5)-methyltransferase 1
LKVRSFTSQEISWDTPLVARRSTLRRQINAVDLFSGAGGLTLALSRAGFDIVGALDAWEPAIKTHRLNFPHPAICADASKLSAIELKKEMHSTGEIDLIVGGPPCQGFSIQRIGADQDSRNNLIFDFGRFVLELRPRMFLMENVPGILGLRGSHIVRQLQERLENGGYDVRHKLVNAADYGVPQFRKRVFYYGWLRESVSPFLFPPPTHTSQNYSTVWDAIRDLPSASVKNRGSVDDPLHCRMRMSPKNQERLLHIPPGGGFESLPVHLRVNCHRAGAAKIGHRYVYGRLASDKPAGTITGRFDSFTRGKFAHPFEDRNITLREGARLQTFPDSFHFSGNQEEIAALIGNAVPPLLATVLCNAIFQHLAADSDSNEGTLVPASAYQAEGPQLDLFDN